MRLNIACEVFVDMVDSVVNRSEQRQLAALFVELDEALHDDSRLAGLVTFWRHQLHAGIEPSHLPELLKVLDALSDSRLADGDLHRSVRHWQVVLRSVSPLMASRQATRAMRRSDWQQRAVELFATEVRAAFWSLR